MVELSDGDHLFVLFRGERQRDRALLAVYAASVVRGYNPVFVRDRCEPGYVTRLLENAGLATDGLIVHEATTDEVYFPTGEFVPERTLDYWDRVFGELTESTQRPSRAAAEMSWIARNRPPAEQLLDYELQLNRFIRRHPLAGVCFYDLDDIPADLLVDLLVAHPIVAIGGAVYDSVWHRLCDGRVFADSEWPAVVREAALLLQPILVGVRDESEGADILCWTWARLLGADLVAIVSPTDRTVRGTLDGRDVTPRVVSTLSAAVYDPSAAGAPWSMDGFEGCFVWAVDRPRHPATFVVVGWRTGIGSTAARDELARLVPLAGLVHGTSATVAASSPSSPSTSPSVISGRATVTVHPAAPALASAASAWDLHNSLEDLLAFPVAASPKPAWAFGVGLPDPRRVVVVDLGDDLSPAARLDAALASRSVPATLRDGLVVLLVDAEFDPHTLHSELITRDDVGRVAIGVGSRCDGPDDVPGSYREACRAAAFAANGPAPVVRFDDLDILHVLSAAEGPLLAEFVTEWLGPLVDYDRRHGGALLPTVRAYLDAGGNQAIAAKTLGVHVSTLKYRLQRVRDVANWDLSDPDVGFHVHLAVRTHDTGTVIREKA